MRRLPDRRTAPLLIGVVLGMLVLAGCSSAGSGATWTYGPTLPPPSAGATSPASSAAPVTSAAPAASSPTGG